MTLSSRIAVMDAGQLFRSVRQLKSYEFPETRSLRTLSALPTSSREKLPKMVLTTFEWQRNWARFILIMVRQLRSAVKSGLRFALKKSRSARIPQRRKHPTRHPVKLMTLAIWAILQFISSTGNGRIIDVTAPNLIRSMNRSHGMTWEDSVSLSWEPSSAMLLNS